ncbi:MAG: TonB-dependent receptor [Bacteroidaceae bacterium]|nr:TonB-dependent receptor [Bacteroidaceae bacterium]
MGKKFLSILACMLMTASMALAQKQITGTVVDSETSEPLIGVAVRVPDTSIGVLTDEDGKFTIALPENQKNLTFSYMGMKPATLAARDGMRVLLETETKAMDEVIVVAFGTAKKSAFTGSAKVVDAEELAKSQVTSVTNALAGAVPGLQLTSTSGAPGHTSTIRIRGFGSLNAGKDPLIIVDGAPYSGDLSNLNPNDVESMTVLKDAASNALYGARGANGVIMITTKKAKYGEAKVTLDAKYGWNTRALKHYKTINSPEKYYELQYGSVRDYYLNQGYSAIDAWQKANENLFGPAANGGLGYNVWTYPEGQYLIGRDGKLNPNATLGRIVDRDGEEYLVTPDDWEDVGTRTGARQEYNLSVSASNEKTNFFSSLGYLNNEGITPNSDLKRLTGRLRADYQAKKWLKVGGNMSYTHFNGNTLGNNGTSTSTGNIWAFTSQIAPIYPIWVRDARGNIKVDSYGNKIMDYGTGPTSTYDDPGLTRPFIGDANPVQDVRLNTRNYEGNALTANGFADITFLPGLVFTVNATANLDETRTTYVYNPYYGQFDTTGGTVEKYHTRSYDYNVQQILNYTHTFKNVHNLNVMVGHEYFDRTYSYLYASKSKMFSQDNKELGGAVVDGQSANSYRERYNNEGWFARAQYDYDTRYFGSASIRRDASSRFHPDHRWGTFWSLGAAWLINKEKWFKASWVDELKYKISIGSQGNDNIYRDDELNSYFYTDTYGISNSSGNIGTAFNEKGSEGITWETNTNFNTGFDFRLFKKLTGSLEYYYRKTSDMLFSFSVAPSLGYSRYYDNIGDMYNTGVELDLNYNVLKTKNINWDLHLNFATLKNRITKLADDKKVSKVYGTDGKVHEGYADPDYNFYITEGQSIYSWYFRDFAGVDPEDGQSMWYKNTFDADGNWTGRETTKKYSEADYYMLGKSTVPPVYGGFGTTVEAYGFDFSMNFSYQLGGKQYDGTYSQFMSSPNSNHAGYQIHEDILNAWSATNTSSSIPRFMFNDLYSAAASSRFLTTASYLNIENINFGYTFPAKLTRKALIEKLRLYLACENVAYFSKRKGFDPRQSYTNTTNATRYSPMRTISLGATVTF